MVAPLIPLAGIGAKLLTGGGIALGAGLGVKGIADTLPEDVKDILGISASDIASKEVYDLNAEGPNGQKGKLADQDFGDWFRSITIGPSLDDVAEAAKKQAVQKQNDLVPSNFNRRYTQLGIETPELTFRSGENANESTKEFADRIAQHTERLAELEAIKLAGGDPTKFGANASIADLKRGAVAARENEQRLKDEKNPMSALNLELRRREEQKLEREYRNQLLQYNEDRDQARLAFQTQQTNAMNAHNARESSKRRAHEEALANHRNEQTMQLAMMDRQDKMADRAAAREDRAATQRQQSIMALIKGLSQMGAGFAI